MYQYNVPHFKIKKGGKLIVETSHYQKIIEHRDNYVYNYVNNDIKPVYVQSPTILLTFFNKDSFVKKIETEINDVLSNPTALKLIDCVALKSENIITEIKNAISLFNDNANCFSNMERINLFIAGNIYELKNINIDELIKDLVPICKAKQECSIICIVDELDIENKSEIKNALINFASYADKNRVFVMGRKKLNGKIPGIETAQKDYLNIICELVLNAGNIILPAGTYSAGYSSVYDVISAFWSSFLSECDKSNYENGEVNNKKDDIIGEIEQCISDEYKNLQIVNLNGVIENSVGGINPTADIETIVKAVYGDALYVYLEHQEKRIDGIVAEKTERIKSIIYSGTDAAIYNLKRAIENRSEDFQFSAGLSNINYGYLVSEDSQGIEKIIFDKFLARENEKLKNRYIDKMFSKIIEIIDRYLLNKKDIHNKLIDEKKVVDSYIINFNKTAFRMNEIYSSKINFTGQASYIDDLCENMNAMLIGNNYLNDFFKNSTGNALVFLCNESEPYCVNSGFNIKKNLFLIGNSCFAKLLSDYDNSIVPIGISHGDFDGILNCTSIDLIEYGSSLN